jgi:AbrB family looped-hinge helix DNA binding protein
MISMKFMKSLHSILGFVTVNEKGQVVIPASARSMIGLVPGDKLLVMLHPSHEGLLLVKPDGLETFARQMLEQLNDAKDAIFGEAGAGE